MPEKATLPKLTPSQMMEYLTKYAIPENASTLIVGQPGIAKTAVALQAAKFLNRRVFVSHFVLMQPEDLMGIPFRVEGEDGPEARFLKFSQILDIIRTTEDAVWILDELGQASHQTAAAGMHVLHKDSRSIAGDKIPDHVAILATSNRPQDNAHVSEFLYPVIGRFNGSVLEMDVSTRDWLAWARERRIHPDVQSYVGLINKDHLCHFSPDSGLLNSPNPRQWEYVSDLLYKTDDKLDPTIQSQAIIGLLGPGVGRSFIGYRKITDLPNIRMIAADPDAVEVPPYSDIATLCAVTNAVGKMANKSNYKNIWKYVCRLPEEFRSMFFVVVRTWDKFDITSTDEYKDYIIQEGI